MRPRHCQAPAVPRRCQPVRWAKEARGTAAQALSRRCVREAALIRAPLCSATHSRSGLTAAVPATPAPVARRKKACPCHHGRASWLQAALQLSLEPPVPLLPSSRRLRERQAGPRLAQARDAQLQRRQKRPVRRALLPVPTVCLCHNRQHVAEDLALMRAQSTRILGLARGSKKARPLRAMPSRPIHRRGNSSRTIQKVQRCTP
mmetsp:Transcript_32023/g.95664  ORF Transcript_32023/g.95664 Transcript_32023/m.95664 type:complete len:204 (+) Transcript_32023:498-1109(+)